MPEPFHLQVYFERAVDRSPSGGRRQKSIQPDAEDFNQQIKETAHYPMFHITGDIPPTVFPWDLSVWSLKESYIEAGLLLQLEHLGYLSLC